MRNQMQEKEKESPASELTQLTWMDDELIILFGAG